MEDITTRPKILRTYGSRRPETTEDDNVRVESVHIAPRHSPNAHTSPSLVVNSPLSSPSGHSVASSSHAFTWLAKLRDIDQGLEDDNLSAIIAAKNATESPPSVSHSRSPKRLPLFSASTPATPSSMSADLTTPVKIRSSLISPTQAGSSTSSPTREQISSLSISPSLDAVVLPSTPKSPNRKRGKDADTDTTKVPRAGKRAVARGKKLSKKEEQETNKETARMLAGRHVSIKTDWRPKQRPMNALFSLLNHEASDPIEVFSSPSEHTLVASSCSTVGSASLTESVPSPSVTACSQPPLPQPLDLGARAQQKESLAQLKWPEDPPPIDDDSDDGVMDPQTLLKTHVSQPLLEKAAHAKKLEWLKGQVRVHSPTKIPEDDDIEIVRSLPLPTPATNNGGRSSFLNNAVSRVKRPAQVSRHSLPDIRKRPLLSKAPQSDLRGELNADLLRRAETQRAAVRAAKEANWVKRGGKLKDTRALGGPRLSELMQQASSTENKMDSNDESEGGEDGDYCPSDDADEASGRGVLRGLSADVTRDVRGTPTVEEDEGNDTMPSFLSQSTRSTAASAASLLPSSKPVISDSTPPSSESSDTELAESQAALVRPRHGAKRVSRRIIVDEDEEVENVAPPPDSDAENARPTMDDSDLENMPPVIQQVVTMETDDEDTGTPGRRSPLKRLRAFSSSSFSLSEIGSRLPTSRRVVAAVGSPRSAPLSELDGGALSDTDVEPDIDFGLGGMSQLFEVNTQNEQSQKRAGGLHRPAHSFDLSTQLTLLPAVQISETKWKMNDEIFLQQQQDGVETRSVTPSPRAIDSLRRPLVNGQNSFFADFESQSWTQPAASCLQRVSSLASETDVIAATPSIMESPQNAVHGPRRIQRGRRETKSPSPEAAYQALAPAPSVRPFPEGSKDAFKVLMSNPQKEPAVNRELVETYMEGEAEESDEEIAFGFGTKDDEDDAVDEEQAGEDGHIKGLVDDHEMDEETQAKDKVLEKVQEHAAEDDARALKIAQDAVDGNFRNGRRKRQRGLGEFDSDDSSDDEDETRRPKIEKKRRIDGDKLHEFGKNPETAAFFKVYMKGINDDEEMIYDGTSFADGDEGDAQSVDSDVSQDENGDINGRETVTVAQLRQEIREKAKSLKETEVFDPMDINWYRDDDLADSRIDGDGLEIEVEVLRPGKPRGPLEDEWVGLASARESGSRDALETTESQLASFARGRSNNSGPVNGRGAAVTGHNKQERGKKPVVEPNAHSKRALRAAPSALSALTARTHDSFQ